MSPIKFNFSKLKLLDETSFIVSGLVWDGVRFFLFSFQNWIRVWF